MSKKKRREDGYGFAGFAVDIVLIVIDKSDKSSPMLTVILLALSGILFLKWIMTWDWYEKSLGFFRAVRFIVALLIVCLPLLGLGKWVWPTNEEPHIHITEMRMADASDPMVNIHYQNTGKTLTKVQPFYRIILVNTVREQDRIELEDKFAKDMASDFAVREQDKFLTVGNGIGYFSTSQPWFESQT